MGGGILKIASAIRLIAVIDLYKRYFVFRLKFHSFSFRSFPVSASSPMGPGINYEKLTSINEEEITEEKFELPDDAYGSTAVGNKQWTVIPFPLNYLPSNWPIRVSDCKYYVFSFFTLSNG